MRSHIHYDFMKCTEFMLALDVQQLVFRAKHRARNVMQKKSHEIKCTETAHESSNARMMCSIKCD